MLAVILFALIMRQYCIPIVVTTFGVHIFVLHFFMYFVIISNANLMV